MSNALDEAYKKAGDNAYFANGFALGVEFAQQQVKKCDLTDVVEPKGKLKCGNCGSIKLRKSLRNQKVYCLECKHSRAF